jgi:protein-tyrosine phosphatase
VVDLRGPHEWDEDPPERLPVTVQREPMDPRAVPEAWNWRSMRESYLALVDRYRGPLARTLTALGQGTRLSAVHCSGGRDRTGIACGMALWLAGVEPEAIAADHALSDESWAPYNAEWLASAPDEAERERRRKIAEPAGRTLAEVLEEVEQREGIRALLVGAGADPTALERLVTRLSGNP